MESLKLDELFRRSSSLKYSLNCLNDGSMQLMLCDEKKEAKQHYHDYGFLASPGKQTTQ